MRRIRRIIGKKRHKKTSIQIDSGKTKNTKRQRSYKKYKRWDAILKRLPENIKLKGAEIGIWNGNTSFRLLRARPLLTLFMIDPWEVPQKGSSYCKSGDDNALKPAQAHETSYRKTLQRVEFAGNRAVIMRTYSHKAAKKVEDHSLDFVFIDGNHSYEGVKSDIKLWLPKIKKGGFISGHDLNHPRLPGVSKAVYEAFKESEVEKDDNRTWFVEVK